VWLCDYWDGAKLDLGQLGARGARDAGDGGVIRGAKGGYFLLEL